MGVQPIPSKPGISSLIVDPVNPQLAATVVDNGNGTNSLLVNTGTASGSGTNGSTAPTSSISNGYTNAAGNQTAVSPSTPLPEQAYGVYNSSTPTFTSGSVAPLQTDSAGDLKVYEASLAAGEDVSGTNFTASNTTGTQYYSRELVEVRNLYGTVTAAGTVTLKSGAGLLSSLTVLGTGGTVTVYDNTAGSGTAILPTFTPTAAAPASIQLNEVFNTGLTIVTSGAAILNVAYR